MSAVQVFLAVLLLLHLSEFLVWVPAGRFLFRRRGRAWEVARGGGIVRTVRGSLHGVWPLPGLARAYVVRDLTVDPPGAGDAASAPGNPRPADPCDPAAIALRRADVARAFAPLRWVSFALLALAWGVGPVSLALLGVGPTLWTVAPVALLVMGGGAVFLARRHRREFPALEDERWRLVLSACLSPLAAMRSWDLAQKEALDGSDPTAVAASLPRFRDWDSFAAGRWRRLRYPAGDVAVGAAVSADPLARLDRLARDRGIDPRLWEAPPVPEDPTHTRYCPRCRVQYTERARSCRDCGGRPLLPIPGSA
jgi:hypothetical protein